MAALIASASFANGILIGERPKFVAAFFGQHFRYCRAEPTVDVVVSKIKTTRDRAAASSTVSRSSSLMDGIPDTAALGG